MCQPPTTRTGEAVLCEPRERGIDREGTGEDAGATLDADRTATRAIVRSAAILAVTLRVNEREVPC